MNLIVSKGIHFYGTQDVADASKISDRIILLKSNNDKLNHWEVYASYVMMIILLTEGYKKISEKKLPAVYFSDIKSFLDSSSSPDDVKQNLISNALLYLPADSFKDLKDVIHNIMNTGMEEFKSILEVLVGVCDSF